MSDVGTGAGAGSGAGLDAGAQGALPWHDRRGTAVSGGVGGLGGWLS